MRTLGRRGKTVLGSLALVAAFALVHVASASAVTFPNACKNSATANNSEIGVTMTATAPASVAPGASFTLSDIEQSGFVPGDIFVAGYNLGLLTVGVNNIPGIIDSVIEGTNTAEGTQGTSPPIVNDGIPGPPVNVGGQPIAVTTTISDPDGTPSSGDESASDADFSVSYPDQTWTAGASPGTIDFREETVLPTSAADAPIFAGGIRIAANLFGGVIQVKFACSPGTVDTSGGDPGINNYDDPAVSFASTTIAAPNQDPIADAGADQTVASEQTGVTLDGSGSSDPDGDTLSYSWTQTAGAPVSNLSGAGTATPSFDAPVGPASLTFELTVDDGNGGSATDSVDVNVDAPANQDPIADAGADQTVASEQTGVTLDGSGSSDPDGDTLSYSWTQTAGAPVSNLSGAGTATPSFDAPAGPDTLTFELTVDDGNGGSATDSVDVNVDAPVNQDPIADAGDDQTVASEQAGVSLDGSGSTDPDGDTLSYSWAQTGGAPVSNLSGAGTATPSFDAPAGPDTLTFELTVDDGNGGSDTDPVIVNVDAPANQDPIADAGADQTVASEQTGVTLDGSGSSDPDGDTLSYSWAQTGGAPVSNLSGAGTATPSFDAPAGPDTLTFELTVDDGNGGSATDSVDVNVDAPANQDPIADAGADQTVASQETGVGLDGSGSSDPDGDTLSYSWEQTAGPTVALSGAGTATPSFDAPVGPASLSFELTVDDGNGGSATDSVDVNVDAQPGTTVANACVNSVNANNTEIPITMTADSPASVLTNESFTLSNITQTLSVPGSVFAAGYNFGLLPQGPVTLPAEATTVIEGTDTVEGTQATNTASGTISSTIVDGNGSGIIGDDPGDSVTDGALNVSYDDQTWTAGNSPGTIDFREDTVLPRSAAGAGSGGVVIKATIAPGLAVTFGCSPGTVDLSGGDPGVVTDIDPADTITSTDVDAPANQDPIADAGADQTVASEQTGVTLDGSGSSDPDGDTLSYSWAQTGGAPVSNLSGAGTATPSFDAPAGPDTLTFELTVDDGNGGSATDSVDVNVDAPANQDPIADAGADQTVASQETGVGLDGSGSSDPDGDTLSYSWKQTAGPTVALSGAGTATPSFDAPVGPASLSFELTVDDGNGGSATDSVDVNVDAQPGTTVANACVNSVNANNTEIPITMTADSPASVLTNESFTLSNITQTLSVPGSVFAAGYNFGLLPQGPVTLPAEATTVIEGTDTVEGTQATNTASGTISSTIVDGNGSGIIGDDPGDSVTDGALNVSYDDQTWTAGNSPGTIDFREDTVLPRSAAGAGSGGVVIKATIAPGLAVTFGCSPGTVDLSGGDPGVVTDIDPADTITSTDVDAPANQDPIADAGADQTVASEQTGVTLDGSGSSDPDGDTLSYSWAQTGGAPVSNLSGAGTATPSFDAPAGPDTLTFELTVDDGNGGSATDSVDVNVDAPVGVPTIPDLIESVEALGLQPRGLENSLVKKLENAQKNLDKGNVDEACDKLGSFIDEVSAQSGKKIDPADADALIADAQAIRASIGCEVPNGE